MSELHPDKAWKQDNIQCLSYGNTEEPATDWNEANIACRAFGKKSPKIPVYLAAQGNESNGQIEGQMSLSDFITI